MRTVRTPNQKELAEEIAALMATFLQPETNSGTTEHCRTQLVTDFAEPLIHKIVQRTMRVDPKPAAGQRTVRDEHAHDAYGEAIVATCRALEDWRAGKAQAPDRFLDYVAIIAYRACGRALSGGGTLAVEYLLTHQQGFALWNEADHQRVCGYRDWQEEGRAAVSPSVLDYLHRDPEGFAEEGLRKRHLRKSLGQCNEIERLMALLDQAGAPIDLGSLSTAYQALERAFPRTLRPVAISATTTDGDDEYNLARVDTGIDMEAEIVDAEERRQEQHAFLAKIWHRTTQLPYQQRAALLLGLERSIFLSLVKDGSTSFQEIASMLDKTMEELAEIWKRLPLDDHRIAKDLGLSAARVNDRRQSAYRTLSWHLRPYDRGVLRRLWEAVLCIEPPRSAVYMLWARDLYGSSLLALLTRESIARRAELPEQLHIPAPALKSVLNQLPLSFARIAHLLTKTPQEVVRLYMEAYSALKLELTKDDLIVHAVHAIVHDQQQQE